ncbi:MAG: butyrate kinase [Oscillospiraceae bacterium]|jgi:butyrate kinase
MTDIKKILVINTGSTSTKVAIYENETEKAKAELSVDSDAFRGMTSAVDELGIREKAVCDFLEENNVDPASLDIIVTRGGILPSCEGGAYRINQLMVDILRYAPVKEHASNVACMIGKAIADRYGKPAIIYDPPVVNEFTEIAQMTGLPDVRVHPVGHMLNSRCVSYVVAEKIGKPYKECNFIVAHYGGGYSVSAHKKGRIVDQINDDIGSMSPQRAGRIPTGELIKLCYSGKYTEREMVRKLIGNAGFVGYFGTQDAREVEKMARNGDQKAILVWQAMAYQCGKAIGEIACVLKGEVDRIIFTGGVSYSKYFLDQVIDYVKWIAPIEIVPGEREMEGLAMGALRVLRGEEAKDWTILPEGFNTPEEFYAKYGM